MDTTTDWQALVAEAEQLLEDYGRSIERGLELARGLADACDAAERELGDARAVLAEWEA